MSGSDIAGGAAQGAAVGAAGGPIGMVVGGVIGAIGGLFSSKAKKYKRYAAREQLRAQDLSEAIRRRNIVLEGYLARSGQVARANAGGELNSSATLGAIASTKRQLETNVAVFDRGTAHRRLYEDYTKRAGKAAGYANFTQGLLDLYGQFGAGAFNTKPASTSTRQAPTYEEYDPRLQG